jgi:hypothetical protein
MDLSTHLLPSEMTDKERTEYYRTYFREYARKRYQARPDIRLRKKLQYYKRTSCLLEIHEILDNPDLDDETKLFEIVKAKINRKFEN